MAEPVNPDTAIALRPIHAFPPVRLSVFEDPADEKSSHGSQRYSGLISHFEGREPSWYDQITREFAGHDRVLDLGAGPGLTLRAFSSHGVREPIGIDRWHGFLQDVDATGGRLILHDLTLPMPFFRSGSFDGIFSHFVLDYISPIGVVQTLREARRLLAPGGLMALHMNAAGLVLGDRVRTTPYDGPAVAELLTSLGFHDVEVDQPETRRIIIVRARGGEPDRSGAEDTADEPTVLECEADGEIQVSAGFAPKQEGDVAPEIAVEVVDGEGSIDYRPDLSSPPSQIGDDATTDVSICLRVVAVELDRFELQAWTWQGTQIAAIDRVGLRKRPQLLRIRVGGVVEHQDVWRPEPPMFEEPADAYVKAEAAGPKLEPEEEWRARGRQVIVEREGDNRDVLRAVAESKDHFVVHRPDPEAPDIDALEEDWRAGQLHGIVLELEAALRSESEQLLQWADSHGVLIYLEPDSWTAVASAAGELQGLDTPLLIVDPLLSGGRAQGQAEVEASEEAIASSLDSVPGLHLVLAATTAAAAGSLPQRYANRILMGDPGSSQWQEIDGGRLAAEATENLRYLTELTTLMWFRGVSGRTGSELGRYEPVVATS
jgi:SAM-dependent methyltransferase